MMDFLQQMGFIYGSAKIEWIKSKKNIKFGMDERKQEESFYDPEYNGVYIKTGKISNCTVINVDDLTKPHTQKLMELCEENCNLICKTRRGYHYYFLYEPELKITTKVTWCGFTIKNDNRIVIVPPTEGYSYTKTPEDLKLNGVSETIKEYLRNLKFDEDSTLAKNQQGEFHSEYTRMLLKNNTQYIDKLDRCLKDIVHNLDPKRWHDPNKLSEIIIILNKFGKYGLNLWKDELRKHSSLTNEEINFMSKDIDKNSTLIFNHLLSMVSQDIKYKYDGFIKKHNKLLDFLQINFHPVNINELYIYYNYGDYGYVQLYYNFFKTELVCFSQKSKLFYAFNYFTKLWEIKTKYDIITHFMGNMRRIFDFLIQDLEANGQIDKAMEIKCNPLFNNFNLGKKLIGLICSQFYNKDFPSLLNNKTNLLPLKNGVLNLNNGTLRSKKYDDYFSFELNVVWKGLKIDISKVNQYFDTVLAGDKDKTMELQTLLGRMLFDHGVYLVINGSTESFKKMIQNLMGPYAVNIPLEVVLKGGKFTDKISNLKFGRFNYVDYLDTSDILDQKIIDFITKSKHSNLCLMGSQIDTSSHIFHFQECEMEPPIDQFLVWIIKGMIQDS